MDCGSPVKYIHDLELHRDGKGLEFYKGHSPRVPGVLQAPQYAHI